MILKKNTVFVIGAGGSIAYGFPSGQELRRRIEAMNSIQVPAVLTLQDCGFDFDHIQAFRRDLEASPRVSVDAFLNSRREFLDVGKHAIAAALIPDERDGSLRPGEPSQDWMRYLFNKLLPPSAADLKINRLRILTFNFDRSFERALWLALKALYGLTDDEAAGLAQTLAPIHVHGDLGEAPWLVGRGKSYGEGMGQPAEVRAAAARIKIVFEEIPDATKDAIREAIKGAKRLCFLGFGYDRDNLRKLDLPAVLPRSTAVFGTVFDLAAGEVASIRRDFAPFALRTVDNSDIMQFLRRTDLIHETA